MLGANDPLSVSMSPPRVSRPPARAALVKAVKAALGDMKAANVKVFDVRRVTDVSDCMILASGTSDRHVRSIADRVVERARAGGFRPMGIEGERDGEWVLVDLNDVIVHVMLPRVREFYGLEELWEPPAQAPARLRARSGSSRKIASPAGRAKTKTKVKLKAKAGSAAARAGRGKQSTARKGSKRGKGNLRPRG
jgi:ribosome-associated protein